ncbi:MAG: prepilin peptidase [Candidatus Eremiobacteraeota bacterium]|nr:prepilin peptidase [Candidatus Eremiobacteraeota bacterium]
MTIAIALTLAACVAASYTDVRARRIPNALTGSLAAAAAIVHAFGGWQQLVVSLGVMALLTIGGALIYSRGGIGGGDIKLAIAASGMLSYPLCVPFLLYTALAGGALAVLFIALRPNERPSFSRIALTTIGATNGITAQRVTLPYAVAFAAGAIVVALSQSLLPFLRINL